MPCTIRAATSEDAPLIVDMIRMGVDEGAFHSRVVSLERFREFAFENPREGYRIFLCQIGNQVAGYIDSRVRWGVGHILGLYVDPTHRRKGIGNNLMDKTLDEFKKSGCHKARLEVFADNDGAINFYTRINFVQEGHLHEDEEKKDIIIMSKFLKK